MKNESYVGVYVAGHEEDKVFHLADYSFHEHTHGHTPGTILKKEGNRFVESAELVVAEKDYFDKDAELKTQMEKIIVDTCTGKTNYDAAVWACSFNPFMQGFSSFNFEV